MTFSYFDALFEMILPLISYIWLHSLSTVPALWLPPSALTHPMKTKQAQGYAALQLYAGSAQTLGINTQRCIYI